MPVWSILSLIIKNNMKVSDYIISYIESRGVHVIFGYIGGMITHLVDSVSQNPNMQFIQTYHEQTAAIAAEGFAKESGLLELLFRPVVLELLI